MKRVLKWLGLGLAGLVGVAVLAVALLYAGTEIMIRRSHPKAPVTITASRDLGAAARGAHLAKVYGCNDCHGANLEGRLFFDEMPLARIAGPNLSLKIGHQSDADLARAIRQGVAADGRELWIMPSDAFANLTDAETADLLAYLRSKPPIGHVQIDKQLGPVGRLGAVLGKFRSAPALIAANRGAGLPDLGPQFAQGRSLARACVECHGADLKGSDGVKSPDLTIAGAYDEADFERLLRTGIGAGDRKLGLMSETAPGRFNAWSHQEIGALHAYLKARAAAAT
jgi:cytochrome c553